MQVSVETTSGLERRMTVAVPAEDIASAVEKRLRSLSKTARLNGFRPGKVPMQVVKKRFEPQVRAEVLGSLINTSYQEALQQEALRPAGQPVIEAGDETDTAGDGEFSFTAVFEVFPEIEPVYDERIEVTRPAVEIADSDIDDMLENLQRQRTTYEPVERAAADGDQVIIDFLGKLDGEAFDGGKAEHAPLVLGSGAMIDGFESQLVGVSAGDAKTIEVTFPEQYQAEHLAGKQVEFEITVHEVRESRVPEFDAELVKSFGIEDGELESLRADVRQNMQRELDQRILSRVQSQVMDGLVALNPIDVPAALVEQEIGRQREQLMQQMPDGTAAEGLADELFTEQATRRVRLGLVISEIVQRESIRADAAAVRQRVEALARTYQDPQQVIDYYYAKPELLRNVEGLVVEEAVVAHVLDKAKVIDEPTAFKDVMNPSKQAPRSASDDEAETDEPTQTAENN